MPSFEENMKTKLKMQKPRCTSTMANDAVVRARFVFWEKPKQPIIPQEQEEAEKKIEVRTLIKQQIFECCFSSFSWEHGLLLFRSFGKKPRRKKSLGSGEMPVTRQPDSSISVDEDGPNDGLKNHGHSTLAHL